MVEAILGIGGNLGDRMGNMQESLRLLDDALAITIIDVSRFYESPAMLPEGAPEEWDHPFINFVAVIETELEPNALLDELKDIEAQVGREKRAFWAPREVDIDILAYGDVILKDERLTIPHTGLLKRDFVLIPWRDVRPDWSYPVDGPNMGKTISQLCDELTDISCRLMAEAA
ncbi:MAG: 2-amino-4-hydroxy-6-hydroxymethyldihydropteridine diphosphokinase [Rickettsiales bacterium]|nr:2-amino-4-hydroxy-6-hydroxymethyldihydropteridine diphosphokinase [Rickettsiales bacterium]